MKTLTKIRKTAPLGFTLVETVVAMGIAATLLATFLAIFGLATNTLDETIDGREADRLISALERELSILREDEVAPDTRTAFDKAYQWIKKSSQGNEGMIFVYTYEGDPSEVRDDGSLEPRPAGVAGGGDSVATAAVRFVEGGSLPGDMLEELEAASGPVFFVRTTQLVYVAGQMVQGKPGIIPPHEGQVPLPGGGSASDTYPEAAIAFAAAFHLLPANTPEYLAQLTLDDLKRPLFIRPLAVRR